jgi:hypothetical protein
VLLLYLSVWWLHDFVIRQSVLFCPSEYSLCTAKILLYNISPIRDRWPIWHHLFCAYPVPKHCIHSGLCEWRFVVKRVTETRGVVAMISLRTLFFHIVSVHFYSLAPTRNMCVYALSLPWLVVFTQPSSHCMSQKVISRKLWTIDYILRDSKQVQIWQC